MKHMSLRRMIIIMLAVLFTGITELAFSQVPASLEKEFVQFYSDIYKALKVMDNQNEQEAMKAIEAMKPKLNRELQSLSVKVSQIPDLSPAQEEAWNQKMLQNKEFQDLMTLLSDPSYMQKIESSPALLQAYEELMMMLDLGAETDDEQPALTGSQACTFVVGAGSPNSGSYMVKSTEDEAYAYYDDANDQFVIEIHEENYIDIMLIIEKPTLGRHEFTMEMQVAIDISKDDGNDYVGFDNHREEGGGHIQIDQLDDIGGVVRGSFGGLFNDSSTGDDNPVELTGQFSVTRM